MIFFFTNFFLFWQLIEILQTRGTVKWYNARKGFSFIKPNDNSDEVFFHQSVINSKEGLQRENEVDFVAKFGYPSREIKLSLSLGWWRKSKT